MAEIEDLIPEVRTHLSGASDPTVELYLRRASRQFCQDTRIWDVNIGSAEVAPPDEMDADTAIALPSTGADTAFVLPADSYINSVSAVRLDGDEVTAKNKAFDVVTRKLILRPGTIIQPGVLAVDVILEPRRGATTIPDFLFQLWGAGIADHAIWEMMTMPNQEWSNPVLAREFRKKYDLQVAEATVAKAREGVEKPIELEPTPFV